MASKFDIEEILYAWLVAATGYSGLHQVFPQDEPSSGSSDGSPRPAFDSFATYKIISGPTRAGNRDSLIGPAVSVSSPPSGVTDSTMLKHSGQYTLVVNCQTYGPKAWDKLTDILLSLQLSSVRQSLKRKQVDIVEVTSVVDSTDYTITIDGSGNTIDSGVGASFLSIRNALKVLINSNPYIDVVASDGISDELLNLTIDFGDQYTIALGSKLSFSSQIGPVDLAYQTDVGETDVAVLLETSWEHRQSIDFTFGTNLEIDDTESGVIEKVEYTDNAITGDTTLVDGS